MQIYGSYADPRLSEETEEEHKAALLDCFRKGPHPSQVQRRKDENWARRWPFDPGDVEVQLQTLDRVTARPPFGEPGSAARRCNPTHRHLDRGSEASVPEHGGVWSRGPGETHRELPVSIVVFVCMRRQHNPSNQIESSRPHSFELRGGREVNVEPLISLVYRTTEQRKMGKFTLFLIFECIKLTVTKFLIFLLRCVLRLLRVWLWLAPLGFGLAVRVALRL